MSDGDYIRNGCGIPITSRTKDNIVLGIRQGVVIAKDDVGLVLVRAVTSYGVMGTDEVIVLAVFQFRIKTFNIVQLSRIVTIFSTTARNRVAHAGDLGHIGLVNAVATAHDHDLAAAPRNGFLQCSCHIS